MKKYRCEVCDWIYDPAVGDPDGGSPLAHPLRNFRMIGNALCVV